MQYNHLLSQLHHCYIRKLSGLSSKSTIPSYSNPLTELECILGSIFCSKAFAVQVSDHAHRVRGQMCRSLPLVSGPNSPCVMLGSLSLNDTSTPIRNDPTSSLVPLRSPLILGEWPSPTAIGCSLMVLCGSVYCWTELGKSCLELREEQ